MSWWTNIIVIVTIIIPSGSSNNILLLKDYITSNDISVVLFVPCEKDNDLFKTELSSIKYHGLWTNVWDIRTDDVASNSKFFDRYSNPPCIVIDLRCNQTKPLLTEMSKRVFFHLQRKWLMWSESLEEVFDCLSEENINFDAEITVAIPSSQQGSYDIYEAYNPSYRRGGQLNIKTMGQWNEAIGWNVSNQTKIERRHNLNGIIFPTVVPVMISVTSSIDTVSDRNFSSSIF